MSEATPEVSIEALVASGWQDVLLTASGKECFAYARAFQNAAVRAMAEGDHLRAAALDLLTQTCLPMVRNEDGGGLGPSRMVDAISSSHLDVLAGFVSHVTDPELSARISDILWLRRRDRRAAEAAGSAYLRSARQLFNPKEWSTGFARTERALNLAASLGKRNALYSEVLAAIEADLERLEAADPLYFSAGLMRLLFEQRAGEPTKLAARAKVLAEAATSGGDWWRANTLHELAGDWYARANDPDGARRERIAAAEAFVSLAAMRSEAEPGAAAMNLRAAVEAYRRIGKAPDRIEQLLTTLTEYQQRTAQRIVSIGAPVDLAKEVERALEHVRGKSSILDALFGLATVTRSPPLDQLRDTVQKSAAQSPIRHLITRMLVHPQTGRVTGRQQPTIGAEGNEAFETAMLEHARMIQHLTASFLDPARLLILQEHPVRDHDLLPLVRSSPFVPPGRHARFARGLAAGLRGDFLVAAALLIPQVENSLRYIVEQRGEQAYSLGDDGIQDAHQLDHLLGLEVVKETLGDDIVFDLRGLLIERFGSNLRHQDAHGLIDDVDYNSTVVEYFWWLTLRLCVVFSLASAENAKRALAASPVYSSPDASR